MISVRNIVFHLVLQDVKFITARYAYDLKMLWKLVHCQFRCAILNRLRYSGKN
jgi:hypothetical protein